MGHCWAPLLSEVTFRPDFCNAFTFYDLQERDVSCIKKLMRFASITNGQPWPISFTLRSAHLPLIIPKFPPEPSQGVAGNVDNGRRFGNFSITVGNFGARLVSAQR